MTKNKDKKISAPEPMPAEVLASVEAIEALPEPTIEERIDAAEASAPTSVTNRAAIDSDYVDADSKAFEDSLRESVNGGVIDKVDALVLALCNRCESGATMGLAELRQLQRDVAALRA